MIRLTWLQFRLQAIAAAAVLLLAAILFVVSGEHLYHLYHATVAGCVGTTGCAPAQNAFLRNDLVPRQLLALLLLLLPALLGIFWGAPLVAREYESGTFRLAWTQSVSRLRWLLTKLGMLGLATVIVAGLLSLLFTWWSRPFEWITADRFDPGNFDVRGVVVIGYALFAFALALTAGVVIRRTLPAMGVTLVAFLATRLAFTFLVRPHLMTPLEKSMTLESASGLGFSPSPSGISFSIGTPTIDNAWAISSKLVDTTGHTASSSEIHDFIANQCPAIGKLAPGGPASGGTRAPASPTIFHDCIDQLSKHYHLAVSYQPASRFWGFQWYEMGIFIGFALLLAAFSFWWVRYRMS